MAIAKGGRVLDEEDAQLARMFFGGTPKIEDAVEDGKHVVRIAKEGLLCR